MPTMRTTLADLRYNRGRLIRARLRRAAGRGSQTEYPVGVLNHLYESGFDGAAEDLWSTLLLTLEQQNVPFLIGGNESVASRRLNVRDSDLTRALRIVRENAPIRLVLRSRGEWRRVLDDRLLSDLEVDPVAVDVLIAKQPLVVGSDAPATPVAVIEIVTWTTRSGPYGTPYVESNQPNSVAARLRPKTFERLARERHRFGASIPPASSPAFPVDIVYTWVDGDDPEWLERKEAAQRAAGARVPPRVTAAERFCNRDELKYSLRSVAEFAPWVRKIHVVTAGQRPDWLNTDHPKIHMVDHEEIYADPGWLPTFNSSGIETQLHHVPGLAERFLYFNDDFMLGQLTEPSDFFLGNGVLKYFPSGQMAYEPNIDADSEEYVQADKNAVELLAQDFGAVDRHIMQHSPYASDRDLLHELEERYSDAFAACAASAFRSSCDLRPIAFMQYHYGFATRKAVPAIMSHRYLALWKAEIIAQMDTVRSTRRFKTFCVNDVGLQADRSEAVNGAVDDFLNAYFPTPSAFER